MLQEREKVRRNPRRDGFQAGCRATIPRASRAARKDQSGKNMPSNTGTRAGTHHQQLPVSTRSGGGGVAAPLYAVLGMCSFTCSPPPANSTPNVTYLGGAATCKAKSSSCTSSRSGITGISATRGGERTVNREGSRPLLRVFTTFNVPAGGRTDTQTQSLASGVPI